MPTDSGRTEKRPWLAVDAIINFDSGIVLVKRKNPPYGWALPGGFVEYGETVEEAVVREVREETGLDLQKIELLGVYSDPERDPRGHTVSVCFSAEGTGKLQAASDAAAVKLYELDALPELAFDHRQIIDDYISDKRRTKNE